MAAAAKKEKPTHVIHVHPKNGINIPGHGHRKHGKHEVVLTEEELELLADAEGITVKALVEEKKPPEGSNNDTK